MPASAIALYLFGLLGIAVAIFMVFHMIRTRGKDLSSSTRLHYVIAFYASFAAGTLLLLVASEIDQRAQAEALSMGPSSYVSVL